jgi:hypothetical protein
MIYEATCKLLDRCLYKDNEYSHLFMCSCDDLMFDVFMLIMVLLSVCMLYFA